MDYTITQATFQQLTGGLVAECLGFADQAMKDAACAGSDVGQVALVGGSTRTLATRELLGARTGVTTLLIGRNTTIPTKRSMTVRADQLQSSAEILVLQGDRERASARDDSRGEGWPPQKGPRGSDWTSSKRSTSPVSSTRTSARCSPDGSGTNEADLVELLGRAGQHVVGQGGEGLESRRDIDLTRAGRRLPPYDSVRGQTRRWLTPTKTSHVASHQFRRGWPSQAAESGGSVPFQA